MNNPTPATAAQAIRTANFRPAWPIEVRKILVRAANTEGDLPPFAVKQVRWALAQARTIEKKMESDIRAAERNLRKPIPATAGLR